MRLSSTYNWNNTSKIYIQSEIIVKKVRNVTEHRSCVAIETIQIDIHSNNELLSVGEDSIYFPCTFHED